MTNNTEKTSYKNVVLINQPLDTKPSKDVNVIDGYENIMSNLNEKKMTTHRKINSSQKELLVDILDVMSEVTEYVNEYFGFHGIGGELKVADVIDSLDKCVKVEVISDIDCDIDSGEEDT